MSEFIPAIITTVAGVLLFTVGFSFLPCVAEKKNGFFKISIVFGTIASILVLVLTVLVSSFTHLEAAPSPVAAGVVTLCGFCAVVLTRFLPDNSLKVFLKRIGKVAVILFLIEVFICNFNRFTTEDKNQTDSLFSLATTADGDAVIIGESSITFYRDSAISFELNSDENIGALSLDFDGEDKLIKATVSMTDENFGTKNIAVGSKFFSGGYDRPLWFSIHPYKTLKKLTVSLSGVGSPLTLTSMTIDSVMPFYFSDIRFLVVLVLAVIVIAIVTFRLYKLKYNCKKLSHRMIMAFTAVLCAASMLIFFVPDVPGNEPIKYEKGIDVSDQNPYVQMFDAFQKGQIALDIEPSDTLKTLENPYDDSERADNNTAFFWDRAYYNGKYYSYYSVVPLFLFYYPYYFMSGGYLPSTNTATVYFAIIGTLLMTGALLALVKRFVRCPNFLLLILSVITCTVAGEFYIGTNFSTFYTLPGVVSGAFLMMCLWCGVSGYNTFKKNPSVFLFVLSGIGFILCVSTRPTKSIGALILAPLFIAILIRKDYPITTKIISVSGFLLPIIIGATGIMAFNYVRFDSFFDFGQGYQLTVSNIQANQIDLSLLPNSFLHYFMQPLKLTGDFPFFAPNVSSLFNNGKYVFEVNNFGVFCYPIVFLGTLAMPFFVWQTRRRKTARVHTYKNNRIRSHTYILMFLLMVIAAFLDYCVGGSKDVYVLDIIQVLMFMSVLVLMNIHGYMKKFPLLEGKSVCVISLVAFVTIIIGFSMLFSIVETRKLVDHYPNLFSELERLICFWY